jgi:hypothetical protein
VLWPQRHKRIQIRLGRRRCGSRRKTVENARLKTSRHIENLIANSDAPAKRLIVSMPSKDAIRKILYREIRFRRIGRVDPTFKASVMGFVDGGHCSKSPVSFDAM